jgi:hypothetical protein
MRVRRDTATSEDIMISLKYQTQWRQVLLHKKRDTVLCGGNVDVLMQTLVLSLLGHRAMLLFSALGCLEKTSRAYLGCA